MSTVKLEQRPTTTSTSGPTVVVVQEEGLPETEPTKVTFTKMWSNRGAQGTRERPIPVEDVDLDAGDDKRPGGGGGTAPMDVDSTTYTTTTQTTRKFGVPSATPTPYPGIPAHAAIKSYVGTTTTTTHEEPLPPQTDDQVPAGTLEFRLLQWARNMGGFMTQDKKGGFQLAWDAAGAAKQRAEHKAWSAPRFATLAEACLSNTIMATVRQALVIVNGIRARLPSSSSYQLPALSFYDLVVTPDTWPDFCGLVQTLIAERDLDNRRNPLGADAYRNASFKLTQRKHQHVVGLASLVRNVHGRLVRQSRGV